MSPPNELEFNSQLLINAYSQGLFPMAEPQTGEIYWYCPDPRAILPLDQLRVPRSLRKRVKSNVFKIRYDTAFKEVMQACAKPRTTDDQTWIDDRIINAYCDLHHMGLAHSVEAWQGEQLVGGLYGVSLNALFAGESMFSRKTDASKVCLVHLVEHLNQRGYQLLDTQFQNDHIAQFGVIEIPKDEYMKQLDQAINTPVSWGD
ncbi:MAG: leucyl/phenylalanyl-tRNA--protein transferase [Phycisphaeraceae bacterium]|nr:leucyl/phenylalanyl-tRNA--protein transferase [Phycisphaeraceae bacterium]